jgi:hypothetical protein
MPKGVYPHRLKTEEERARQSEMLKNSYKSGKRISAQLGELV